MTTYKELSKVKQSLLTQVSYLQNQVDMNVMVRLEHYSDGDNFDLVVLVFAKDGALISDEVTHTFETNEKEEAIKEGNSLLEVVMEWCENFNVTISRNLVMEEF
jgi:hypothetical protein